MTVIKTDITFKPVSYTHLDVYKRQALHQMEIHRNNKNEVRPLFLFPHSLHFRSY